MNSFRMLNIAVAALLPIVAACGDDPASPATSFTATLAGTNEVPAVTTTATGTATLSVSGSQITYTINVTNLQNAVLGHIHLAAAGANGDVRLNLCGTGALSRPARPGRRCWPPVPMGQLSASRSMNYSRPCAQAAHT